MHTQQAADLIAVVGRPNVRLMFDVFHVQIMDGDITKRLERYLPIIGPLAIAGLLAQKKYIPETAGTLRSDSYTFGVMTFAVIVIIAALAFFPALTLGPLAEYFSIR